MTISLIDAAKYYESLEHQNKAWDWLQKELTPEQLDLFAYKYRNLEAQDKIKEQQEKDNKILSSQDKEFFLPSSSFSFYITPHIRYGEITLDQETRRFNNKEQCKTCKELCEFLEKVRTHFSNNPIRITSGYRPPAINSAIGGSSFSEHLYNDIEKGAIDFYIDNENTLTVQEWCDEQWPYSLGYGASKGFIHIGMRKGKPRVRWDY